MPPDAAPDDVGIARRGAVLEGRPAIRRPRHLEDARRALDTLHPEAGTKPTVVDEVGIKPCMHGQEPLALCLGQRAPVAVEL